MVQKSVASGGHAPLAWKAKLNPSTGVRALPRKMRIWQENEEEEAEGEEILDEGENEPISMTSDAEWEGWRRELEVDGPTRPDLSGLKAAEEGSRWTSNRTQQSFVTESDGFLPKKGLILGRHKRLEEVFKRTKGLSVHSDSLSRRQPSRTSTSLSVSPSVSIFVDMTDSSGPSTVLPSTFAPISPRQSLPAPNRANSATIANLSATPKSSYHTHNYRFAIPRCTGGWTAARPWTWSQLLLSTVSHNHDHLYPSECSQ